MCLRDTKLPSDTWLLLDGNPLVSASKDGVINVWSLYKSECSQELSAHEGALRCLGVDQKSTSACLRQFRPNCPACGISKTGFTVRGYYEATQVPYVVSVFTVKKELLLPVARRACSCSGISKMGRHYYGKKSGCSS